MIRSAKINMEHIAIGRAKATAMDGRLVTVKAATRGTQQAMLVPLKHPLINCVKTIMDLEVIPTLKTGKLCVVAKLATSGIPTKPPALFNPHPIKYARKMLERGATIWVTKIRTAPMRAVIHINIAIKLPI